MNNETNDAAQVKKAIVISGDLHTWLKIESARSGMKLVDFTEKLLMESKSKAESGEIKEAA